MNRSPRKSPSRKGSASPSRRPALRKVTKSPVRSSLRSRSRSRGRPPTYFQQDNDLDLKDTRQSVPTTPPRARKPLRTSPRVPRMTNNSLSTFEDGNNELDFEKIAKAGLLLKKSPSIEREKVIRHSISRFDEVVSEAVVNVRSSTKLSDLKTEVENEVKTLLTDNDISVVDELPPIEFGGSFGAFTIMIAVPAAVVLLQLVCSKDNCSRFDFKNLPTAWQSYFNLETTIGYVGFLLLQLCFGLLPSGIFNYEFSDGSRPRSYRCNGLLSTVLTVACAIGTWYEGWYNVGQIVDQMVPLLCTSIVVAFVVSVALYLESMRKSVANLNLFGRTGNFFYDFWVGRIISLRLGPVDVKLIFIRASIVTSILINIMFILTEVDGKHYYSQYSTPLILVCTLQIVYLMDFLFFEKDYMTSFMVQHEGSGFKLLLSLAVFPYFITLMPKFIFYNEEVEKSYYVLFAGILLHSIGYTIFRLSNSQKARFRKDFENSQFSSIQTLVCINGKRLLVGGLWSKLQHPNHLGALIQYWSWSLLAVLCTNSTGNFSEAGEKSEQTAAPYDWVFSSPLWLPIVYALVITLLLVYRSLSDSRHCAYRYGSPWKRYTARVKYHMLPKIF